MPYFDTSKSSWGELYCPPLMRVPIVYPKCHCTIIEEGEEEQDPLPSIFLARDVVEVMGHGEGREAIMIAREKVINVEGVHCNWIYYV